MQGYGDSSGDIYSQPAGSHEAGSSPSAADGHVHDGEENTKEDFEDAPDSTYIYPNNTTDQAPSALVINCSTSAVSIPTWATRASIEPTTLKEIQKEHHNRTVRVVSSSDGKLHNWNNMIGTIKTRGLAQGKWHVLLEGIVPTNKDNDSTFWAQVPDTGSIKVQQVQYMLEKAEIGEWFDHQPYIVPLKMSGKEGKADSDDQDQQYHFHDTGEMEAQGDSPERSEAIMEARNKTVIKEFMRQLQLPTHTEMSFRKGLRIARTIGIKPKHQFYHADVPLHKSVRASDFTVVLCNIYPSGMHTPVELYLHGHGKVTIPYQNALVMRGDCEHAGMAAGPSRGYISLRNCKIEDGPMTQTFIDNQLLNLGLVTTTMGSSITIVKVPPAAASMGMVTRAPGGMVHTPEPAANVVSGQAAQAREKEARDVRPAAVASSGLKRNLTLGNPDTVPGGPVVALRTISQCQNPYCNCRDRMS